MRKSVLALFIAQVSAEPSTYCYDSEGTWTMDAITSLTEPYEAIDCLNVLVDNGLVDETKDVCLEAEIDPSNSFWACKRYTSAAAGELDIRFTTANPNKNTWAWNLGIRLACKNPDTCECDDCPAGWPDPPEEETPAEEEDDEEAQAVKMAATVLASATIAMIAI